MMDYLQLITVLLAGIAAFISFQNFRLSGKKRVSEFRQAWLHDLRDKLANVFAELSKWESGEIDLVRLHYLMEYIDMMLDMSIDHHKAVKNAIIPLALSAETRDKSGIHVGFDKLGTACRDFFAIEQKSIESSLERWI